MLSWETRNKIKQHRSKVKLFEFLKWVMIDIYRSIKYGIQFTEYGLTMYCGRQGDGKTSSMVDYLERMRIKYPDALIITNFGYVNQHYEMTDWHDLLNYRNGVKGVIFAIDELSNEFNSLAWQDFPEFILSEITQQRKQRIKIVGSSQVFTRVVKVLREQCYNVVECATLLGRWTFQKSFDADEYNKVIDDPDKKNRLHRQWRSSFVQTDDFRKLFGSYDKIEKLERTKVAPRDIRKIKDLLT